MDENKTTGGQLAAQAMRQATGTAGNTGMAQDYLRNALEERMRGGFFQAADLGKIDAVRRVTSGVYMTGKTLIEDAEFRRKMILGRLMTMTMTMSSEAMPMPFEDLHTFYKAGKVHVFVFARNQGVVLEDDAANFPSDTLIGQLRLLA